MLKVGLSGHGHGDPLNMYGSSWVWVLMDMGASWVWVSMGMGATWIWVLRNLGELWHGCSWVWVFHCMCVGAP